MRVPHPPRFARLLGAALAALGGCGAEDAAPPEHVAVHKLDGEAEYFEATLLRVARTFLAREGGDELDMLVLWGTAGMFEGTSYLPLRNDVEGLGPGGPDGASRFDRAGDIGSARLQGIVWMGDWADRPARGGLESTLGMLAHETAHRWAATLRFNGPDGRASERLLSEDGYHWSFLLDNGGSPLGGNAWVERGDRRFEAVALEELRYSPLDLYLMGLLPARDVGSLRLLTNVSASFCADDLECSDGLGAPLPVSLEADAEEVRLEQILELEGPRRPEAGSAPRVFSQAWVYVTRSEAPDAADLDRLEHLRVLWEVEFAAATGGLGRIRTELTNLR